MKEDSQRVFYLVPLHQKDNGITYLSFPSDLPQIAQNEDTNSLGFGIFAFLRHEMNRGKPRMLTFPAIRGFDEDAQEVELTLRSDYPSTGNANRFVIDTVDESFSQLSFIARKFPASFALVGNAMRLTGHNLWALIPENRDLLETLWRERRFYFIGYGK